MTQRTASLLMMFVAALAATGVLLAVVVWLVDDTGAGGVWLMPALAVLCQSAVLFLGRSFIFPPVVASPPGRAALIVLVIVASTMALALGALWGLRALAGHVLSTPILLFIVWFGLLWLAVQKYWQKPEAIR